MKIDFTKTLRTIKGEPIKQADVAGQPDLTLEAAAIAGLFAPPKDGQGSVQAAGQAFKLALRISNSPSCCEIDATESVIIKEGVGRFFNYAPAVCGPVEALLEGEAIIKD